MYVRRVDSSTLVFSLSSHRHSITFMHSIAITSGRIHSDFVCLLFLQNHRETDCFFFNFRSSVCISVQFHYRRVVFSSQLKSKCGNGLPEVATLRIILNIDGAPVSSRSHTHPSHSETSRLLTSSCQGYPHFFVKLHSSEYWFVRNTTTRHYV